MEIMIAKSAGFCFGVSRAVEKAYQLLKKSGTAIYTLGPIIHNSYVIEDLRQNGINVVKRVEEVPIDEPAELIIRAHGVSPDIYQKIYNRKEISLSDATCPYVKKIHNLVRRKHKEGYHIIIVGDTNHPEVEGIKGWCNNAAYIIAEPYHVNDLQDTDEKICVVAQTTLNREKWDLICNLLKQKYPNIDIFDTVCNATTERQTEAAEIAKKVNVMIVIGDASSSNTQKLYEICKKHCVSTYKIESFSEIPNEIISIESKVGITAGASTPTSLIEDIIKKLPGVVK